MRHLSVLGVILMALIANTNQAGIPADVPAPANDLPLAEQSETHRAVLASGCFWCTEAVFENVPGVIDVISGYSGGSKEAANYEEVCTGRTDHAEAVEVTYDASKVTYGKILQAFFLTHDPTTLNRQGPDVGRQYRSAIFYSDDKERQIAQAYIRQLNEAGIFGDPIVTSLEPFQVFYPAERYHQDYARNNPLQPYIQRYALPKADKAKKRFGSDRP